MPALQQCLHPPSHIRFLISTPMLLTEGILLVLVCELHYSAKHWAQRSRTTAATTPHAASASPGSIAVPSRETRQICMTVQGQELCMCLQMIQQHCLKVCMWLAPNISAVLLSCELHLPLFRQNSRGFGQALTKMGNGLAQSGGS